MEINLGLILGTIANFLILLFGLKYFFFDKVQEIIEKREVAISEQLDETEEELEKARTLAIQNERILKKAREEGKKITEEEKKKAEKIYEEIVAEAKSEASLIIDRAKVEIERERERVEYGLKKEAIELAVALSQKVIEKNIDEDKNRELIDKFISEVGN